MTHELPAAQHQHLQPLQLGVGQRLDEALLLGVLVQHAGELGQHGCIQAVGLGQRTHRAGEVAHLARIDHRRGPPGGLQRAGASKSWPPVACSNTRPGASCGVDAGGRGCKPNASGASWTPRSDCKPRSWARRLAYMDCPKAHWLQIHSTNPLERLNAEIKCRTNIVAIFPNDRAITRLVGAMLL